MLQQPFALPGLPATCRVPQRAGCVNRAQLAFTASQKANLYQLDNAQKASIALAGHLHPSVHMPMTAIIIVLLALLFVVWVIIARKVVRYRYRVRTEHIKILNRQHLANSVMQVISAIRVQRLNVAKVHIVLRALRLQFRALVVHITAAQELDVQQIV